MWILEEGTKIVPRQLAVPEDLREQAGTAYAESRYPLTAYGWSPLESVFDGRWKLIVSPP